MSIQSIAAVPIAFPVSIRNTECDPVLVIVGLANAGKSTLFNTIAKTYTMVANYPQTTVAPNQKKIVLHGRKVTVIDTPGISSLVALTPDEQSTLDLLLGKKPCRILFCGDALRLKQSLILFAQIRELAIPTVFCLNKADEAARRGIVIDTEQLSREAGTRVILADASHGIGMKPLLQQLESVSLPVGGMIQYPEDLEQVITRIGALFDVTKRPSRGQLLQIIQSMEGPTRLLADRFSTEMIAKAQEILRELHWRHSPSALQLRIFNGREEWAERLSRQVTRRSEIPIHSFFQKLAWASRHPWLGWPIFLAILWLTFHGVVVLSSEMAGFLDGVIFKPLATTIEEWVNHPGINEFLVGNFGLLTMGLFNAMVTVVPILLVFFLIMNILEDTGYLPNLSVLANRTLSPFGLSGKAVLPLVLGTGCNTMATLTSRILETRKERLMAVFLIALGMPCAVQLGIMMAILATIPFSAMLIVLAAVAGTQIVCGVILNRVIGTRQGKGAEFILELPPFRWPDPLHVVRKTYYRVKWFLWEAVPMFMVAALMMYTLEKSGILERLKEWFHPVVTGFLSLPDKVTEVFILVLSRREVGAVYFKDMVDGSELSFQQIVVGLVVMTLFIPCASNTMMMIKEIGPKWAISMNIAIILLAILVGGLVNFLMNIF
ncbi:MAG: ferrous iron transport protein B [Magnetococcales bacterium]|nr:ferrous iron transport protein B [Magnetococcales bacterium]